MKKSKPWYEKKIFWYRTQPLLFSKDRLAIAPEEVERIIKLLKLKPDVSVLDLCCGVGRHSIELASRGFNVTGVDITERYLVEARKKAKRRGVNIAFIKEDMRRFKKKSAFDVVLNLFSSFGFFESEKDDRRVVKNVYASLNKGGVFLMELMGKEILARIYRKTDWIEKNGYIMLEEREPQESWRYMKARWIIIKGSKKREFTIRLRLYSASELTSLLRSQGFRRISVYGDLSGAPYNHTARRLVVKAKKSK